jgi:protein tyrosine/serine phosphatase
MSIQFRQIETGLGTIFFGPMWNNSEKAMFAKECEKRNIKIICNLLEDSHGNIGNIKEIWYPIKNHNNPDITDTFIKFIRRIISEIKSGKNIYVHCLFGLGRTSFILKSILMELGKSKEEAVNIVDDVFYYGVSKISIYNKTINNSFLKKCFEVYKWIIAP